MMREFLENGYRVIVESMFGQEEYSLDVYFEEDDEIALDHIDEDKKIAYFCDCQDYDD